MGEIREIPLANLFLDVENPRFESPQDNEAATIAEMVREQGSKLVKLAEHICENGLSSGENLFVEPIEGETDLYTVLEGNRRVAALKLLGSPKLIEMIGVAASTIRTWQTLFRKYPHVTVPSIVSCTIMSRAEAKKWIDLKHTGENGGAGIVEWNGAQTGRFRGPNRVQTLLAEVKPYLDQETQQRLGKISVTTIERLISTPAFREAAGVDKMGHLINSAKPFAAATSIRDIAHNKIRVSDVYTAELRNAYAKQITERTADGAKADYEVNVSASENTSFKGTSSEPVANTSGKQNGKGSGGRKLRRTTLTPKGWWVKTTFPKLESVFRELQKLKVDEFPNACAVLLRFVIESTTNEYVKKHSLNPKRNGLSPSVEAVADNLVARKIIDREKASVFKALCDDRSMLGLDAFRLYAHHIRIHPTGSDLIAIWDNIQPYLETLLDDLNSGSNNGKQ